MAASKKSADETTTPKSAPKKESAPKAASTAKAPSAAKAPKKTAAPKKAAAPVAKAKTGKMGAEEHYRMVEVAAYFIAERNNFAGHPVDYWAEAEKQIDKLLAGK